MSVAMFKPYIHHSNAGKCWQMLANAGKCWQMLANAGKCWQMLANAGKCRQMPGISFVMHDQVKRSITAVFIVFILDLR
jgi:hypothetical protein